MRKQERSKPMTQTTQRVLFFIFVLACLCSLGMLMIVRSESILQIPRDEHTEARLRNAGPQHTKTAAPRITPKQDAHTKTGIQADFYQFIIDNNLFRPLGYRPPRTPPRYKLNGTLISENDVNTTAMLIDLSTQVSHTVRIGDKIGTDIIVTDIKEKQVILVDTQGKKITLQGPQHMFMQY